MPATKFRSYSSSLTDDELVILDVMFSGSVTWPMLRQVHFRNQFNEAAHSLSDTQLVETLHRLLDMGIIVRRDETFRGHRRLAMTPAGGELWSSERQPVWDRFCTWHTHVPIDGRDLLTVIAVSPEVCEDCVRLMPEYQARRRTTVITDFGLLGWRSFERLHIGLATYVQPQCWVGEAAFEHAREHPKYLARLERERTWWHDITRMQRFVESAVD